MKLSNFNLTSLITINQSPHGQYQGNCAMDFALGDLYAQADGEVSAVRGSGQQRYFDFKGDGYYIQYVHYFPIVTGRVKRGQLIAKPAWNHLHAAINVGGKWQVILDYMDRNLTLKQNRNLSWSSFQWESWTRYSDKHLPGTTAPSTSKFYDLIKLNRPDVISSGVNIDQWWTDWGEKELILQLSRLDRFDVIHAWAARKIDLKTWFIDSSSVEYPPGIWKTSPFIQNVASSIDDQKYIELKQQLQAYFHQIDKLKQLSQ